MNSKLKYERWVPPSYRKVDKNTPQVSEHFFFKKLLFWVLFVVPCLYPPSSLSSWLHSSPYSLFSALFSILRLILSILRLLVYYLSYPLFSPPYSLSSPPLSVSHFSAFLHPFLPFPHSSLIFPSTSALFLAFFCLHSLFCHLRPFLTSFGMLHPTTLFSLNTFLRSPPPLTHLSRK